MKEEGEGVGKIKQDSTNIGMKGKKKSEALIPLLFQLRSVRSQEDIKLCGGAKCLQL